MDKLIDDLKIALYKIYYEEEYNLFEDTKYTVCDVKKEDIIKRYNIKFNYINTLEKSINCFVDLIKDEYLRKLSNLKKVKIEINFFDKSLPYHLFILNAFQFFYKNKPFLNELIQELLSSIVILIYDDKNKLLYNALLGYRSIKSIDIEYLQYIKSERKKGNSIILCNSCHKENICLQCNKCHNCYHIKYHNYNTYYNYNEYR